MQKGQLIAGRFELVAKVATGGMGSIFRARDLTSGSPVAVKTWPPTRSAFDPITQARKRERALRRFEREAAALAAIDHPAVVRYIAHGVTASAEPFLVMDWVEGHDLADKLGSSGLDVTETLELAERVLAALAVLHARGVVHRDLKPANVMLEGGQARHAVLVDFGIARGSQPLVVTDRGAQLGTPCYMSPEQIRDPRAVDGRADVFALGCILFECLTGARAFQDDDALGTIAQVLLEGAPDLRQIRPDLPAPVASFAMSLLASDREQRPFADAALVAHVSRLVLACKKQPFGAPSPRRDAAVGPTGVAGALRETLDAQAETPNESASHAAPALGYPATDSLTLAEPSGPMIAREAELAQIVAALAERTAVITLWGPPGIGKTRLALELRRRAPPTISAFESLLWVDLSLARDPASALRLLAGSVGARLSRGETVALAVGRAFAGAGRVLAVLDGADALLPDLAALIAQWRQLAPLLTVIVTSRARLPITGALTLELGPLATLSEHELDASSSASPLSPSPSARLFLAHATLVGASLSPSDPPLASVERIVRELDGIPLAIELAAARVPSLGVEGVLSLCTRPLQLLVATAQRATFDRSSLHAALRSAWASLSVSQRTVLGACAVFCGSFSAQSAAALVSPAEACDLSPILEALREKSLLRVNAAGFCLFSVVREFALSELSQSGELEAARVRHAAYAGRRAALLVRLVGERELAFTQRVEAESDDLIAAIECALDPRTHDLSLALNILSALEPVIVARGPLPAFLDLIDRAVAAADASPDRAPTTAMARLLVLRARLRTTSGRFQEANADLRAAEQLAEASSDSELAGSICLESGLIHHFQRELAPARHCYQRALSLLRPTFDGLLLGRCYGNLGAVFHDDGKLIEAAAYYWKAIQSLEAAGDVRVLANFLGNLALLEQELGARPSARRRYEKAIALLRTVDDRRLGAIIVGNLGSLEAELGDWLAARDCHERALGLLRPLDDPRSLALCQARLGAALAMLGLLKPAAEELAQAQHRALADDPLLLEIVRLQHTFLQLGSARAAHLAGDRTAAFSLLEQAEADCRRAERQRSDGRSLSRLSDDIRTALRSIAPLLLSLRAELAGTAR